MPKYNTKQREEIIDVLRNQKDKHLTVNQIMDYLKDRESKTGIATVYRQLDYLVEAGLVNRYFLDKASSAIFEYAGKEEDCHDNRCYHFKCEKCGELIHISCKHLEDLEEHMIGNHGFEINTVKTIFYGTCQGCGPTASSDE